MSQLVTKEEYYDAALEVLAQLGFKGLNIGVLCKRLGVTSGSFYHHFGGWPGFQPCFSSALISPNVTS